MIFYRKNVIIKEVIDANNFKILWHNNKNIFCAKWHNPPHIHAIYGEYMSAINIETLEVLEGDLPDKALRLVREWMEKNKEEIMNIWNTQNFRKIKPLE